MNTLTTRNTAEILIEALPYIHRFRGKTVVVKFGGNAMTSADLQENFARDIVLLHTVGIHVVVVHGGGPQIDGLLERLGIPGKFVGGLRVTDSATMEVVEMMLGGQIGKHLVAQMQKHGGKAVSVTGKDGGLIRVQKKPPVVIDGMTHDLGRVGEIVSIDPQLLRHLYQGGYIPVVAPVGVDEQGSSYNINADTVAGELAVALSADKLILLTNTAGILDKSGTLITGVTPQEIDGLIADGTITGGMIPKISAGLMAAHAGVSQVHIVDGRVNHALLLELFTNQGVGTMIRGV